MVDSTSPLSDGERSRLKASFGSYDPTSWDSRVTHLFYSTGMHPSVLADPGDHHFQIADGIFSWDRAKTRERISVPIDPDISLWATEVLETYTISPTYPDKFKVTVHRFGRLIGLPELTPRTLRHDYAFRVESAKGAMVARELTGTTPRILLGYARRRLAKDALKDLRGLF